MAIVIHPAHRRLAMITHMCMDINGNFFMGLPELALIMPLLLQNLELVCEIDKLKELAYQAQVADDMEWVMELTQKLEELEVQLN